MRYLVILFLVIAGPCWGAVYFDDVDDYFCLENATSINLPSAHPLTITVWYKPSDVTTTQRLFSYGERESGGGCGYAFYVGSTGYTGYVTWNVFAYNQASFALSANEWYFLAVTVDSSHDATFYGYEVSSKTWSSSTAVTHTTGPKALTGKEDIHLGSGPNGGTFSCLSYAAPSGGIISDVAVYNTNLSEANLQKIAYAQLKRNTQIANSNLKEMWSLDEGSEGLSMDDLTVVGLIGQITLTGSDGSANTGLTGAAETALSYP